MSTKEQKDRIELLQGTLDLLILRTLLLGPSHGHVIAKAIEFKSDDVLQVEQGSLYPALHQKRNACVRDSERGPRESTGRIRADSGFPPSEMIEKCALPRNRSSISALTLSFSNSGGSAMVSTTGR
jgi:hypothetical protein